MTKRAARPAPRATVPTQPAPDPDAELVPSPLWAAQPDGTHLFKGRKLAIRVFPLPTAHGYIVTLLSAVHVPTNYFASDALAGGWRDTIDKAKIAAEKAAVRQVDKGI